MAVTKKTVKCLDCGFEATNIEPHVSAKHGLKLYIDRYNAKLEDFVHHSLLEKSAPTSKETKHDSMDFATLLKKTLSSVTKEAELDTEDSIILAGEKIAKCTIPHMSVPAIKEYFHFGRDTASIIKDIKKKRHVLLTGHTGTGKTSLIHQIAARIGQGVIRVNLNGHTTNSDFVGFWTIKGGETVWVDGALPYAMRNGLWLILDELDCADANILATLNGVLEDHARLLIKEKGHELVIPHENFRIFATGNSIGAMSNFRTIYQGTNIMNEAFLDRFQIYLVGYLPEEEEIKVLTLAVNRMSERVATFIVKVATAVRAAFQNEEIGCTFSLRRMLDWGEKIIETKDHITSAESTIINKLPPEDGEVVRGIIQRVMGARREE